MDWRHDKPISELPAPRAAYVHVPFCAHRCGYCNFTVVAGREDLIGRYLRAIERELSWLGTPREVDTLYIGGGTPTQLPPAPLGRLLTLVTSWFPPAAGYEFSVEANPLDIRTATVDVLAGAGVNRISLGAQSFNAQKLQVLERDHGPEDVARACQLVRSAMASVSLDLIFAAPGESQQVWQSDLQTALGLEPDHLSIYGLTFERGTTFWNRLAKGVLSQVDEEQQRALFALAIDTLTGAGLEHYEISNFARPEHRCRHNEAYWLGHGYYAAGPGASRYVSGDRETNHRSTSTYLKRVSRGQSPVAERETLAAEERARERLVFGLRMMAGVDDGLFQDETGYSIAALAGTAVRKYVDLGMLQWRGSKLQLTRQGLFVSDAMWPEFLGP